MEAQADPFQVEENEENEVKTKPDDDKLTSVGLNIDEPSKSNLDEVIGILPSMKAPTVNELFGGEGYAVETVVPKDQINILIPELRGSGASDIVEIPISKIVRATMCPLLIYRYNLRKVSLNILHDDIRVARNKQSSF